MKNGMGSPTSMPESSGMGNQMDVAAMQGQFQNMMMPNMPFPQYMQMDPNMNMNAMMFHAAQQNQKDQNLQQQTPMVPQNMIHQQFMMPMQQMQMGVIPKSIQIPFHLNGVQKTLTLTQ